jgi:hypothetical protein
MLACCLRVVAILSAGLPATASAAKKRFRGETAQSRMVNVVVNESAFRRGVGSGASSSRSSAASIRSR